MINDLLSLVRSCCVFGVFSFILQTLTLTLHSWNNRHQPPVGLVYRQVISQDLQKKKNERRKSTYRRRKINNMYYEGKRMNWTLNAYQQLSISGLSEEKARRLMAGSRGTVSIQRGVCRTNGLAGVWITGNDKNQGQQDPISRCVGMNMWWVTFPDTNGLEPLHSHSWLVNNEELSGSTWCFTFKPCGIIFTSGSTQ